MIADGMKGRKLAIGDKNFIHNVKRKNKYHVEHRESPYRQNRT
jgi:hypothetical protein